MRTFKSARVRGTFRLEYEYAEDDGPRGPWGAPPPPPPPCACACACAYVPPRPRTGEVVDAAVVVVVVVVVVVDDDDDVAAETELEENTCLLNGLSEL